MHTTVAAPIDVGVFSYSSYRVFLAVVAPSYGILSIGVRLILFVYHRDVETAAA